MSQFYTAMNLFQGYLPHPYPPYFDDVWSGDHEHPGSTKVFCIPAGKQTRIVPNHEFRNPKFSHFKGGKHCDIPQFGLTHSILD